MSEKKTSDWEMKIVLVVFFVMCLATLIDIVPAVDGATWATRLYGIVCLCGVIFCAKNKGQFMFIDSFVLMYPKALQKALTWICYILELVVIAVLEVAVIMSFMNVMGGTIAGIDAIYDVVLYVLSIITYPIAFVYILVQIVQEARKGE